MSVENSVYPLSRYWFDGDFCFYYAFGNTPPQDYLQNATIVKEPEVLVLGCGDPRSCFYTLWKNFDVRGLSEFEGVHFVFNDISAAVLARNILLLYLCLKMPEEEGAVRKWLSGMWAIWYCHELHQDHFDMLNESLRKLCHYGKAWSSQDNPLYPLVKFTSPATLKEVSGMWKMWLNRDVTVRSVDGMLITRMLELSSHGWAADVDRHAQKFVEGLTEIAFVEESDRNLAREKRQKFEAMEYLKKGSVYAESVLGLHTPHTKTSINYTFFERRDKYSVYYQSLPFSCYYQLVQFNEQQLENLKSNSGRTELLVKDGFKAQPFLANSVQQFSLWVRSAHTVLLSEEKISFEFDCSHALSLCYNMENSKSAQRFHFICSSNLMDHLTAPSLVLSAVPLLRENGLLLTCSLFKDGGVTSMDEYLALSFGFDRKLFPLVLGVRCINHEGARYASPIPVKPYAETFKGFGSVLKENCLLWERLPSGSLPLVFPDRYLTRDFAEALFSCIQLSLHPLLATPELFEMANHLSLESAVKVIQAFISNTCSSLEPDFWKPLCNIMQRRIKPYLSGMQTQLYLHGIHMHLTVSEKNCLFCTQGSLSKSIGLFSATFELRDYPRTPMFVAVAHRERRDEADVLSRVAKSNGNVHIFDCVSPSNFASGSSCSTDVFLQFYAPLSLAREGYKVTVINVCQSPDGNEFCNVDLATQPLQSLLTPFKRYKFFQAKAADVSALQLKDFGTVTSHVSDGDTSEVAISYARGPAPDTKLKLVRMSSDVIQLLRGECTCLLRYPYPIAFDDIGIVENGSKGLVSLKSPRAPQKYEEERPVFATQTNKELSLLPLLLSKDVVQLFCGQQLTVNERRITKATKQDPSKMPPMASVKLYLATLFQTDIPCFCFVHPKSDTMLFVVVNQKLFDYENKVPVLDLAFCCPEKDDFLIVSMGWLNITLQGKCQHITIGDEYYDLKTMLQYFARRTIGSCRDVSRYDTHPDVNYFSLLVKERIQEFFTRAVVAPLLRDPDQGKAFVTTTTSHLINSVPFRCSYCKKISNALKKCSRCEAAQYCDKECQVTHWPEHKTECKLKSRSSAEATVVTSEEGEQERAADDDDAQLLHVGCVFCGRSAVKLKSCARCKKVRYCGEECQHKHWKTHKLTCKKL